MSVSGKKRHQTEGGFSLIETVAAMGILALATIPLMQVSTDATRNSAYLEKRLLARIVAENVMARAISDPLVIDAGANRGSEEQLGRTFTWLLSAAPVSDDGLQSLEVTVLLEGDEQPYARFTALKVSNLPVLEIGSEDEDASEDDREDD